MAHVLYIYIYTEDISTSVQKASGYICIATFSDNTTEGMLAALQKV
jgi:3,4-dihydroxy-2-butanone 4-phosphate synthase